MKKILFTLVIFLIAPVIMASEPNVKTTTESYQDWQIACVEQGQQARCEMRQNLLNQNKGLVAVLSMAAKPDGSLLFQIALPHLLDLKVPVEIVVDEKKAADLPYSFCNATACFVVVDQPKTLIGAFRAGTVGRIKALSIANEDVVLGFSLKGFSCA
ncbi:MAG: invasion associated locus B family protein [Gammaproteobacteria bacterium]